MRIKSTTLFDKKSIKRKQPYRNVPKGAKPPAVVKKVKDHFDDDVVDLTDQVELLALALNSPVKVTAEDKRDIQKITKGILEGIAESTKKLKRAKPKTVKLSKHGQSLVILLSDLHYGKRIVTKSGKVIFDSEIAHKRIAQEMPAQIIDFVGQMKNPELVEEVVFILAGDMVDNDIIYPIQRLQIDSGVAEQFAGVINALLEMVVKVKDSISLLAKKPIHVRIDGLTGNHGRATKDSETAVCSWDTAVYAALDMAFRHAKEKDVTVHYSLDDFSLVNIRGHRGLITHSAPPQSESPSAKKKFGGWYEIFDYDFMAYGDLHHWGISCYNGKPLIMNGSLCGYDEYAISLGVRDDWTQLVWTVTDEDPIHNFRRLQRGKE